MVFAPTLPWWWPPQRRHLSLAISMNDGLPRIPEFSAIAFIRALSHEPFVAA